MPPLQYANLLRELEESNTFFDDLVDMIPANLYVAGNSGDDKYNTKYFKGQHKESKEARKARNKASKRMKFDPDRAETTRQVKERLANTKDDSDDEDDDDDVVDAEHMLPSKSKGKATATTKKKKASLIPEPESGSSSVDPGVTSPSNTTSTTTAVITTATATTTTTSTTSRIEALRQKLHAKLAEQRALRPSSLSDPNMVSKRAARRAEKQKRQEEAKKNKGTKTKVAQQHHNNNNATQYNLNGKNNKNGNHNPSAEVDLQHLDFGKLAGLNGTPKNFANNKSLSNVNKKKNLHKMLADAEEKKQKLETLKRSTLDADKAKAQQLAWNDALKEASGERIKDDPAKLKKALKKRVAKKEKSAKAWKSRMDSTKKSMDERQSIRNHNLAQRKVGGAAGANLSSKRIEKADDKEGPEKKTRKARAGFEGKKQGFLNSSKSKSSSEHHKKKNTTTSSAQ